MPCGHRRTIDFGEKLRRQLQRDIRQQHLLHWIGSSKRAAQRRYAAKGSATASSAARASVRQHRRRRIAQCLDREEQAPYAGPGRLPRCRAIRASRRTALRGHTVEQGPETMRPQTPAPQPAQNRIAAITRKHLIAAVALQNDLDSAAQLAGQAG